METIDIFYQGHGIREIEHIEIEPGHTVAVVRDDPHPEARLRSRHADLIEDVETPLEEQRLIVRAVRCRRQAPPAPLPPRRGGGHLRRRDRASSLRARARPWRASRPGRPITKFGMTEEEAGEHVLQIAGTQDRPPPGTHIGTLTSCPACRVHFDLVPDERINGAPGAPTGEGADGARRKGAARGPRQGRPSARASPVGAGG